MRRDVPYEDVADGADAGVESQRGLERSAGRVHPAKLVFEDLRSLDLQPCGEAGLRPIGLGHAPEVHGERVPVRRHAAGETATARSSPSSPASPAVWFGA